MTITRDGEAIAFYLDSEVVCPLCVTEKERALCDSEETLSVEELWCDRRDAGLITPAKAVCCT